MHFQPLVCPGTSSQDTKAMCPSTFCPVQFSNIRAQEELMERIVWVYTHLEDWRSWMLWYWAHRDPLEWKYLSSKWGDSLLAAMRRSSVIWQSDVLGTLATARWGRQRKVLRRGWDEMKKQHIFEFVTDPGMILTSLSDTVSAWKGITLQWESKAAALGETCTYPWINQFSFWRLHTTWSTGLMLQSGLSVSKTLQ